MKNGETGDLFELAEARRRRDAGLARVSAANALWLERCFVVASKFMEGGHQATGEEIRFHCQQIVGRPTHPNAWGALINLLIRSGKIRPTGTHRPMRAKTSHARSTPVYDERI